MVCFNVVNECLRQKLWEVEEEKEENKNGSDESHKVKLLVFIQPRKWS